jgi:hypothetical protein
MQRRGATCGQGRPQGRRLAAKRFFNGGNGVLLESCCGGWFDTGCGESYGRSALGRGLRPRVLLDRFRLGNRHRAVGFPARRVAPSALQPIPNNQRDGFVNGAGVCFLLGNTELGQHVDDRVRWNFELPCQLVDANFRHS